MNDTTRTDAQIDALGTSAGRTSGNLGLLARAVDRAAGAFGGVITGAPRSLSEFAGGLETLVGVSGPVSKAMAFAEGYVTVWQNLTDYGVNFGNQLDQMITTTGRANMRMEQLGSMVQKSSVDLAGFGPTANAGVQQFLASQARFYQGYQGLDMSLRQLGLTTDDINDRFLTFDAMSNVNNLRQRMGEQERMQAGARFAESVDKLAKLTGKQADELAREQLNLSRQGNIYARDQELMGKSTQGTTARLATRFNAMGEDIGRVATDFLTRGFPDPNDPAFQALNNMAPQLQNYLMNIRRAQSAGDLAEVNRLENETVAYLGTIRRSRQAQQFAQLGSANEFTAAANRIMTSMNNSAELLSEGELRARVAQERGISEAEVTGQQIAEYRQRQLDLEISGQRSGEGTRAVTDLLLQSLQQLQLAAQPAQEAAVRTIFSGISGAATELRDGIASIDWQGAVSAGIAQITGIAGLISPSRDIRSSLQDIQSTLTLRSRYAESRGDQTTADFLSDQADYTNQVIQDLTAGRITEDQARAAINDLGRVIQSTGAITIDSRGPLSISTTEAINRLPSATTPQDGSTNAIGTFGRTGAFFANYGAGTNVRLDGLEGVFRPSHIEDIMARGSRGTITELVRQLNSSLNGSGRGISEAQIQGVARSYTSTLDGRLNTLRASITRDIRESQTMSPDTIQEQVNVAMSRMPTELRRAFEDALGSTIKSPIEQLVTASMKGAEFQERTYKNTKGLSSNILG